MTILLSRKKYCPDDFVFKEQTEGEGFGEGFEEGDSHQRRARGTSAGVDHWMHPLEVVGPPKIKDSSGLMA